MKHQNLRFHENARIVCTKHPLRNMSIFLLASTMAFFTGALIIGIVTAL